MPNDEAIILFAHGARDPEWAAPFRVIREQVKLQRPEVAVELAFLEFMSPPLESAVAQLIAGGARRITLVPLFMAQGGHLKHDLPLLIERIRAANPGVSLKVAPAVGDVPDILQAISAWVVRESRQ